MGDSASLGPDVSDWDESRLRELDHAVCADLLREADDGLYLRVDQDEKMLKQMAKWTKENGVIGGDWQFLRTESDIDIYHKDGLSSPFRSFKANTIIPLPAEDIVSLLWTSEFRLLYDELLDSYKSISTVDENLRIERLSFRSPMVFIRNRDFVGLQGKHEYKNHVHVITTHSVVHTACPPSLQYIRGVFHNTGFVVVPLTKENTQSRLTFVLNMNPRGLLPNWASNIGCNYQIMTIARFRAWASVKANATFSFKSLGLAKPWAQRIISNQDDMDEGGSNPSNRVSRRPVTKVMTDESATIPG